MNFLAYGTCKRLVCSIMHKDEEHNNRKFNKCQRYVWYHRNLANSDLRVADAAQVIQYEKCFEKA